MTGHPKLGRFAPAIACLLLACTPGIPPEALQINPQTLAQREASSRSYDTGNEGEILSASDNEEICRAELRWKATS